ncbi:MAG: class flavin-dependent oxidoreductase [Devosia sp.]|uniref:LLM class flavin-dependent oxidoreductase n=1 Tax=Devosia sp. TaxID=1871048 RepID=UPI00260C6891|nr:LLM class flavin-dependent oxidoreductase [Devosia sp.]MDB5541706.1 class flavin-dependent oxidoreductase [Devosia sp.]
MCSAARAGYLGVPVMLPVAGQPQHFVSLVDIYRRAAEEGGHDPKTLRVGVGSHGLIAEDAKEAADVAFPTLKRTMIQFGKERGRPPPTRAQYDAGTTPQGAYFIGDPQQVIDKILFQHEWFKHDRFGLQITVGTLPHDKVMKAIELYGNVVAPPSARPYGHSRFMPRYPSGKLDLSASRVKDLSSARRRLWGLNTKALNQGSKSRRDKLKDTLF